MRYAFFFLALLVNGFATGIEAQVKVTDELTLAPGVQKHAGLDEVYRKFSQAYRDLDAGAFKDIYTSDAAYLIPGQEVQVGLNAVVANFARFFDSVRQTEARLTMSFEIVQRKVEGAMAYDVGIYIIRTFNKQGTEIGVGKGKFVVVGIRTNDKWMFQVDGYSAMPADTAQAAPTVASVSWIAGCWEINDTARERIVQEQWMKPAGGVMLGMARTIRAGRLVNWEFTRLIEKDGDVFYVAKPSQNAAETFFKLVKSSSNEAVFENPEHDFPQRIIYRRSGDKLTARIEGTNNGKPAAMDYPFTKATCG
ncbi:MAG: hypothetical protein KF762_00140 [Acidobacteria bacterium]|nr:hypothetical protein [Acidobacteriota bacterium]